MPKVWGYCRGSTAKQELTLIAQAEAIKKYFEYKYKDLGYTLEIVEDAATSASVAFPKRPGGLKVFKSATKGDALVVTKLDRAFRNMRDMSSTMEDLRDMGVSVHMLDINVSTDTDVGKLMSGIMSSVADFERGRIITRTKEVLALKKQKLLDTFKTMRPFNPKLPLSKRNTPYGWGWDDSNSIAYEMPEDIELGKIVYETYIRCLARVKRRSYQERTERRLAAKAEAGLHYKDRKKEIINQKMQIVNEQYPMLRAIDRLNMAKIMAFDDIRNMPVPETEKIPPLLNRSSYRNKTARWADRMHKAVRDTMEELIEMGIRMPEKVLVHRSSIPSNSKVQKFAEHYGEWRLNTIKWYVRNEILRTSIEAKIKEEADGILGGG